MSRLLILSTLLLLSLLITSALALDVTVDSRGTDYGDYVKIEDGLAAVAAAGGGTVTVNPGLDGIYREHGLDMPSNTCLRSSVAGIGHVTIDGEHQGGLLSIDGAANVQIQGFILTRGDRFPTEDSGGAIYCIGGATNIVIDDCVFLANRAHHRGAIYFLDSTCTLTECDFIENAAVRSLPYPGHGAGVIAHRSTVDMTLCTFTDNLAWDSGGAIYSGENSSLHLRGTVISGNRGNAGGGVYVNGGHSGPSNLTADSCEIFDNIGYGADGLLAGSFGPNQVDLNCTDHVPARWVVEGTSQLNIDPDPTVPCMKMSTASFPFQVETASMVVAPQGNEGGPSEVRLFGETGTWTGTITVTLNNSAGAPLDGIEAHDIWLDTTQDGLLLRPLPGCGSGPRFASIADAATGAGGQTTISQSIFGAGSSSFPDEKCRVMTSWGAVGKGSVSDPEGIDLNLYANSVDIDGDFNVDLDDCIIFAEGIFSSEDDYNLDFIWDGEVNLHDLVMLANHCGESVGEPQQPVPGQTYEVDLVLDDNGTLTNCLWVTEPIVTTAYVLIRDYTGGPILGYELEVVAEGIMTSLSPVYPDQGINYIGYPDFNVGLGVPYIPTGSDAILMEFDVICLPGFTQEFRLGTPTAWTSVPGRPVPTLRGAQPDEFYELVPATGAFGDVVASVNSGCPPLADFGDAPDYPDAYFPTRFNTTSNGGTEPGVCHLNVGEEMLGDLVSAEHGADDPLDPDGPPNLINADAGDDGIQEIYLRRWDRINGDPCYRSWVKAKVTVAAGAPDVDRWLYLLFDGDGDKQWKNLAYHETRDHRLQIPPGTSQTHTMFLGTFPLDALPPSPEPHNWLRATLCRQELGYNWLGAGQFDYGETEDYDNVPISSLPPGFEVFHRFVGMPASNPRDIVLKVKVPVGSSLELVGVEPQDHGAMTRRDWVYAGVAPAILGTPVPDVGSFIDGGPDWQEIHISVTPMPIPSEYRTQSFGVNFQLNGYDGLQGAGNKVWSSEGFVGCIIRHSGKTTGGFGELAFGGANTHPAGTPIPVYPDGGGQPLAHVVFGNDQPTPGTIMVIQEVLEEAPGTDVLPVVTVIDADFDIDPNTPPEQSLVQTTITGLHLGGYDDAMVAAAGLVEAEMRPYLVPMHADENFDYHSTAGNLVCSDYQVDLALNKVVLDDPVALGVWYLGAPSISGIPQERRFEAGNYPNPFNPRTAIKYNLTAPGGLQVEVYSLRGELVATLVSADYPAGEGEVIWDGNDASGRAMPSGVYMYLVRSPEGTDLGKMTLVR